MIYPRKVYLIFPFGENGSVAGVYVGSSYQVEERIKGHIHGNANHKNLHNLHAMMIKYGFAYGVVDEIDDIYGNHLEYDWANYFSETTRLTVFNAVGLERANWHRLDSPKERLKRTNFKVWQGFV